MNKLAWNQIVIALVLGAGVGFVAARYCAPGLFQYHWSRGKFQQRLLDRFSSKLQLSPEQHTQVGAILEAKRQKIDALRAEIRPRFEDIRTTTSAEIRQLLTPEQQQKFDTMQAEWDARKQRFRDRWMGPDGNG